MKFSVKCVKLWCCFAALLFPSAGLAASPTVPQHCNSQLEEAERSVKDLAKQFPEILAQARDSASMQVRMARVGAEIQRCVNNYITSLPATADEGLNRKIVASQVSQILSGVEDRPPAVFVLGSRRGSALLIFDTRMAQMTRMPPMRRSQPSMSTGRDSSNPLRPGETWMDIGSLR